MPELLRDFEERCAYSGQHVSRAGGVRCMEVDHFDCNKKLDRIQEYENLFLAARYCNIAKGRQPNSWALRYGLRLLNPCKEMDYGPHMVEDPESHMLLGLTKVGKYHIAVCGLNADHFVRERSDRAEIWRLLRRIDGNATVTGSLMEKALEAIEALRKEAQKMIPELPLLEKEEGES